MEIKNKKQSKKKKFVVIDANSVIHRAFYALPPLTNKKKELVNAVYGFLSVFFKIVRELQPDYIVACFDFPAPTFRHKEFKEYKAKRPPLPKELSSQIAKVKEALKVFNVPIFEKKGFEADDLIGTISGLAFSKTFPEIEVIILSGDLDTLQLINSHIKVWILKRGVKEGILYDEVRVKERYGILPGQLLDFCALKGDPSDNIPGVSGIGEKTAIKLIKEFGSLEDLYKEIEENSKKVQNLKLRLRELLLQQKKQAFLSKMLAQIKKDVPIDFNLEKCRWGKYDKEKVTQFLKNLEFYSLIKRLPKLKGESTSTKVFRKELPLW